MANRKDHKGQVLLSFYERDDDSARQPLVPASDRGEAISAGSHSAPTESRKGEEAPVGFSFLNHLLGVGPEFGKRLVKSPALYAVLVVIWVANHNWVGIVHAGQHLYRQWFPPVFRMLPLEDRPPLGDLRFSVERAQDLNLSQFSVGIGAQVTEARELGCTLTSLDDEVMLRIPGSSFEWATSKGQSVRVALYYEDQQCFSKRVSLAELPNINVVTENRFDPSQDSKQVFMDVLVPKEPPVFVGPEGMEIDLPEAALNHPSNFKVKLDGGLIPFPESGRLRIGGDGGKMRLPTQNFVVELLHRDRVVQERSFTRLLVPPCESVGGEAWGLSKKQEALWDQDPDVCGRFTATKKSIAKRNNHYGHSTLSWTNQAVPMGVGTYIAGFRFKHVEDGSVSLLLSKDLLEASFPARAPGTGRVGLTMGPGRGADRDSVISDFELFNPRDSSHHHAVIVMSVSRSRSRLWVVAIRIYLDEIQALSARRNFEVLPREIYLSILQRGAKYVVIDQPWLARFELPS